MTWVQFIFWGQNVWFTVYIMMLQLLLMLFLNYQSVFCSRQRCHLAIKFSVENFQGSIEHSFCRSFALPDTAKALMNNANCATLWLTYITFSNAVKLLVEFQEMYTVSRKHCCCCPFKGSWLCWVRLEKAVKWLCYILCYYKCWQCDEWIALEVILSCSECMFVAGFLLW